MGERVHKPKGNAAPAPPAQAEYEPPPPPPTPQMSGPMFVVVLSVALYWCVSFRMMAVNTFGRVIHGKPQGDEP